MKKFLALLMALCLAVPVFPALVACAEEQFVIAGAEDFSAFAERVRAGETLNAVMTENIDLAGSAENAFAPIPSYGGIFDGGGHSISGLYINESGDGALFLELTGQVNNLTVSGVISGRRAAAIAVTNGGSVTSVRSNVMVSGTNSAAGITYENTGTVAKCENTDDITVRSSGGYIAGIAAVNKGEIRDCVNFAQISTVGGASDYAGGVCAYSDGGTLSGLKNSGTVYGSGLLGGIVGYALGSGAISDCVNSGSVVGNGKKCTGGIAGYSAVRLENCVNYGSVENGAAVAASLQEESDEASVQEEPTDELFGTGGIAGFLSADGSSLTNYGYIAALDYAGGVAGIAYGNVGGAVNYGNISGRSDVGGVIGYSGSGVISDSSNHGGVSGSSRRTGGIAGSLYGGVERCCNAGQITGGTNYTGGIVGYIEPETVFMNDVYNTVTVQAVEGARGEIAGRVRGTVKGAFSLDKAEHSNYGGGSKESTLIAADYSRKNNWGDDTELFKTLAAALNTLDGTVEDRGVWTQGPDGYPVFADYNEADIDTPEELVAALTDPSVTEIKLASTVTLGESVTVAGDKTLTGGQIIFTEGSLLVDDNVTLSGVSIRAEGSSVVFTGAGTLTVNGYIDVNAPIEMMSGTLDLTNGCILNSAEAGLVPSFVLAEGAAANGAEECSVIDDGYYYYISSAIDMTQSLVVPAAENGLPYDINSSTVDGEVYLFLPDAADLSSLTFAEVTGGGTRGTVHENVDFTDAANPVTVNIGGLPKTVTAMKSDIPALYFDIDESYGTINAMNTSPDHNVKCYGDVQLIVPERLKAEKGWADVSSLDYQDKNPEKAPGTMEIKGRGNSTWVPDLTTKKPYQFKFEKKADVLGMGESKTWLIIRNDEDIIRNKLALDLGHDMNMTYTGYGEFVDVFMNGEYLGNYLLTEKVEVGGARVNVSDLDDEYEANGNSIEGLDMTGGYLVEVDNWGGDDLQVNRYGTTFSIKEPEDLAKTVTDDNEYAYIKHYLEGFLDAVFGDGLMADGRSFMSTVDMESFAKYFWHQEFLRNRDCGRGSTYFYKDKDAIDPLLYAGPLWDNDRIYEPYNVNSNIEGWLVPNIDIAGTGDPTIYKRLLQHRDFAEYILRYYRDNNLGAIFAETHNKIAEYTEYLRSSAAMNAVRWGYNGFDISRFDEILQRRAQWVEENADTILEFSAADTTPLTAYIYNGGIVASVYNGGAETMNAKLVLAGYKDGGLTSVKSMDVALEPAARSANIPLTIPEGADSCTLMLVRNYESIEPLAKSVTLEIH